MPAGYMDTKEYYDKVLQIKRVSKKTKGGNSIGFTALVVVGNKKGRIGVGLGKAQDVASAVRKGTLRAKASLVDINLKDGSIAHRVEAKYGGARVMLQPAPEGAGIIAGGVIRHVAEFAGIKNISSKMLGTSNKLCNVRCALKALQKLKG